MNNPWVFNFQSYHRSWSLVILITVACFFAFSATAIMSVRDFYSVNNIPEADSAATFFFFFWAEDFSGFAFKLHLLSHGFGWLYARLGQLATIHWGWGFHKKFRWCLFNHLLSSASSLFDWDQNFKYGSI